MSLTRRGLALLLSLILLEGLSWVGVEVLVEGTDLERVSYTELMHSVTDEEVRAFRDSVYDRKLGWVHRPGRAGTKVREDGHTFSFHIGPDGARLNPYRSERVLVSAYGDSFTYCADVNDDETWPYYLSELTDSDVRNFGMSAFGTDQALLRLQRNLPGHRTEIVILAILSENVGRLLSMYRPFYEPDTGIRLGFKPMFRATADGYELLRNPLVRADSRADYLAAFETATRHDYWYGRNQDNPEVGFPYLWTLIRAVTARMRYPGDLWGIEEAVDRMDHVLGRFVALSREYDFQPVVLFLPKPRDLKARRSGKPHSYAPYVEDLRRRAAFAPLIVIDLLETEFEEERFNRIRWKSHASPYGNQVIARAVYQGIRHLLPAGDEVTPHQAP